MAKFDKKDSGWCWMIVLASFATQFISEGVTYTFGVFFKEISNEYGEVSKSSVSWIASIMIGTYHAIGPVGSVLINRFGLRAVSLAGAIIAATGYSISYFANGVVAMYFTIGILAGAGLSLLYLPSMVSVAQFFDKRRALAIGLSVSGSGLGTIFFEWVTGYLLDHKSWRLTLLITSGMILAAVPFSLLFRAFREEKQLELAEERDSKNRDVDDSQNCNASSIPPELSSSNSSTSVMKWLAKFLNFSLLKNPVFLLFAVCDLLMGIGFNIPYLYLPEIENGNNEDDSKSTLLGIIGGTNVVARIITGFFSDQPWLNRKLMYGIVLILSGAVTVVCPHLPSIMYLRGYAAVYGACIGAYMTLKSVILVDLFGVEQLTDAYGFLLLFQAFGFLIGPPIVGTLYDSSGEYHTGFYFAGGTLMLSGCLSFFIPILKRYLSKRSKPSLKYSNSSTSTSKISVSTISICNNDETVLTTGKVAQSQIEYGLQKPDFEFK